MNKFLNSKIGKYFFYTLLYVCIFTIVYAFGCFINNDFFWFNKRLDEPIFRFYTVVCFIHLNLLYIAIRMLISSYK